MGCTNPRVRWALLQRGQTYGVCQGAPNPKPRVPSLSQLVAFSSSPVLSPWEDPETLLATVMRRLSDGKTLELREAERTEKKNTDPKSFVISQNLLAQCTNAHSALLNRNLS